MDTSNKRLLAIGRCAPGQPITLLDSAQLINQTSGNVEWYTPPYIIEAARRAMGSIDLDPASCTKANETVKAANYYDMADDGLCMPWQVPNLWLNHPFGKATNKPWIDKLVSEYKLGNFEQACGICFASTSESWFQPLYDFPLCFINKRVNYVSQDGQPVKGVTKGSVVYYLGPDRYSFIKQFKALGRIMIPAMV